MTPFAKELSFETPPKCSSNSRLLLGELALFLLTAKRNNLTALTRGGRG